MSYDPKDWFDSFQDADLAGLASRESFSCLDSGAASPPTANDLSCLDSEPQWVGPIPPLPDGKAASPPPSSQPSPSLGSRQCRDDPTKLLFQLIPPEAEEALARVLSYGARKKYGARNWEKGLPWSETIGSLRRHLNAFMKGETHDAESGLLHTDHLICNAAFLCTMVARRPDLNDLPWSFHDHQTD